LYVSRKHTFIENYKNNRTESKKSVAIFFGGWLDTNYSFANANINETSSKE